MARLSAGIELADIGETAVHVSLIRLGWVTSVACAKPAERNLGPPPETVEDGVQLTNLGGDPLSVFAPVPAPS